MSKGMETASKGIESIGNAASKMGGKAGNAIAQVTSTLSKMGPVGMAVAAVFAVVATAVVGVTIAATKMSKKIDEIAKSAKSVNMTANGYFALRNACKAAGVDMQKMLNIIQRVDDGLQKAAEGNKKAIDMFHDLGLSVKFIESLEPEKRIGVIVDAIRQLKAEGKDIPTSVKEFFGRRNIPELNKASEEDFGRMIVSAKALGITLDENAIRLAENYVTSMGDAGDALLAMASRMKLLKEAQSELNELAKEFTKNIRQANGEISKEDQKLGFIGIGNFTRSSFEENGGNLTTEQKKLLRNTDAGAQVYDWMISGVNYNKLTDEQRKQAWKELARVDTRFNGFNIDNPQTYVVRDNPKAIQASPEEIAMENAEGAAQRYIDALEKANEQLVESAKQYDEIYEAEKRIAAIEKETGATLSDELKQQIMLTAEKNKQLSMENEQAKNKDKINDTFFNRQQNLEQQVAAKRGYVPLPQPPKEDPVMEFLKDQGIDVDDEEAYNKAKEDPRLREKFAEHQIQQEQRKYDDLAFLKANGIEITNEEEFNRAREIYKEELEKNAQMLAEERKYNLKEHFNRQQQGMRSKWLESQGHAGHVQNMLEQNRRAAYEAKGSPLTKAELKAADQMTLMQDALDQFTSSFQNILNTAPGQDKIHTNELAEKGGFVGGVQVEHSAYEHNVIQSLTALNSHVASMNTRIEQMTRY